MSLTGSYITGRGRLRSREAAAGRAWIAFLAASLAAASAYPLLRGHGLAQALVLTSVQVGSVVAIIAGVRLHRPSGSWIWLVVLGGQLSYAAANFIGYLIPEATGRTIPFPSPADPLYLTGCATLAAALFVMNHRRSGSSARSILLDGGIICAGLGVLSWTFLMAPYAKETGPALLPRALPLSFPLADLVVICAAITLLLSGGSRRPSFWLLVLSLPLQAAGGSFHSAQVLSGDFHHGEPYFLLWLGGYALIGAAALHPSMRSLTEPSAGRPPTRIRAAVLGVSALLPSLVVSLGAGHIDRVDITVAGILSIVLFGLVFGRVGGMMSDLSERRRLENELRHLALHDSLTGLPNRRLFLDRLQHALERGSRRSETHAVLFIDIDDFKSVNDRLGHEGGDALLREVSIRLRSCLRTEDTAARLGGDEFAVLIEGVEGEAEVRVVTDRILTSMHQPFVIRDQTVRQGCSIGLHLAAGSVKDPDHVLQNADLAMYQAKIRGKGRVETFQDEMRASLYLRTTLKEDLLTALDQGQFVLHYQPIHRLDDGAVTSVESLIRWQHPARGLIAPLDFIPAAEEMGFINDIGLWVLKEACRQLAVWRSTLGPRAPQSVSVNLSVQQLESPNLVDEVSWVLSILGLEGSALTLEITETFIARDAERAHRVMNGLKELGVRLSIDDFGTGYSSLDRLRDYPVDQLKIDKSFTGIVTGTVEDATLTRSIIMLGSSLSLDVIAEGVETEPQREALTRLGVRLGQGYLFSRPVPAAELEAEMTLPMPRPETALTRSGDSAAVS